MLRHRLAALGVALELVAACGQEPAASSGFTSGQHPITSTASSSGSSGSAASTSNSGSTSEDSGSGAVSASGTTTGNASTPDLGVIPDFGGQPIGCQGKIDFLFVISSWYSMKGHQTQLQEAFPAFTAMLADEFADFDYHLMVVDAGTNALLEPVCDDCYMCIGCMMPGCADFGGPPDYPCNEPKVVCDVTSGAGVTITGNFNATNKRCDLFGGKRYIVKGEPDPEGMFKCIATLGEGPKTPVPMEAMQAAFQPGMLNGGCNDGFLRNDALLAVVVLNGDDDRLTPGTPQAWYDTLVTAKGGNEEAIVTLVLSQDNEFPDALCKYDPMMGPSSLRLFAEAAAHGRFESICLESYVPALEKTAATIIEQCSLLIPG